MRQSLGANTNPNVEQFRASYRKLLYCSPHISTSVITNCNIELPMQLLTISADDKAFKTPYSKSISSVLSAQSVEVDLIYELVINVEMDAYTRHVYALVASTVESEVIRKIKVQTASLCQDCANNFNQNTKICDSLIAKKISRGESVDQPCVSTLNIILASEKINETLQVIENVDFSVCAKAIFNNVLYIESLYEQTEFENHNGNKFHTLMTHKDEFILNIITIFLGMKAKNICEKISFEDSKEEQEKRNKRRIRILEGK